MTPERLLIDAKKRNYPRNDRLGLITILAESDEREIDEFIEDLEKLIEFAKTNVGKFAFEKRNEPKDLLNKFWQQTSDACPLEATEAEKQKEDFNDWVIDQYEQLEL